MESNETQNWYKGIITKCNELAERFGLDDFHLNEMREFVLDVARSQYKSGSKSGYWFAKKGGDKKLTPVSEAAAA